MYCLSQVITLRDNFNSETATYKSGSKWTMAWALWKGEGNFTGTASEVPGHFAYEWKDDKIVTALYYFDPTSLNAEVTAMTNQSILTMLMKGSKLKTVK